MKKSITIILTFFILVFVSVGCGPIPTVGIKDSWEAVSQDQDIDQAEDTYSVIRVVDGDTIIVNIDGVDERVRLIGVDTPESVHPDAARNVEYGEIASDFTREHLEGENVSLEYDVQERDRYGRILAYVYLEGEMFNKILLGKGHAKVATYPPNVKYVDDFTAIQKQAQKDMKGVWAYDALNNKKQVSKLAKSDREKSDVIYAYVGNSNTMRFHKATCRHAKQIAAHNVVNLGSREEAIKEGYILCKVCNP